MTNIYFLPYLFDILLSALLVSFVKFHDLLLAYHFQVTNGTPTLKFKQSCVKLRVSYCGCKFNS